MRRRQVSHKETSPKETKENVNLVTVDKRSLFSPPIAEVLVSGEETLASLQSSLDLLTYGVPCMDQEMHEGEEEDTSTGTLGAKRPSLLLAVGDTIVPVGGTLVFCQEVPTYQLI